MEKVNDLKSWQILVVVLGGSLFQILFNMKIKVVDKVWAYFTKFQNIEGFSFQSIFNLSLPILFSIPCKPGSSDLDLDEGSNLTPCNCCQCPPSPQGGGCPGKCQSYEVSLFTSAVQRRKQAFGTFDRNDITKASQRD